MRVDTDITTEITTNILLVDDRPQNLLTLRAILEPLGQNLVAVESGEAALRQLLERDFAVILLDVLMPGLDGFETAAVIKQREKTRSTPIIFLTAVSAQEAQVFRGYDVGAVDYIAKPFNADILRSKVAVFVDLYKKGEQIRRQGELLRQSEQRERIRAVEEQRRLGEERYQVLAESMPQIVWTVDAAGDIDYTNRCCTEFTGLSSSDLRQRGWQAALHPRDADDFVQGWGRAIATGTDYEASHRLKRAADGEYRWHLLRAVPVRHAERGITSWIGTCTDIDDHKRASDSLALLADVSTLLARSLDYGSSLQQIAMRAVPTVADWCALDVLKENGGIQRIAQWHADPEQLEVLEQVMRAYLPHLGDASGVGAVIALATPELVTSVEPAHLERWARDAAHASLLKQLDIASYACVPLLSRGGVVGALSFGTGENGRRYQESDLTLFETIARRIANAIDNARLYEIAQRERTALEQANRSKDEFLAVVSHELRSPLNSILGWTQLLRAGLLTADESSHALEAIERNSRSQAQLIGDLLDVSRIIAGKLRLVQRALVMQSVIELALDSVRPAAQEKGIEITTAFADGVPRLLGDADRLQQIVWNLLSNAIKFTPRGGTIHVMLDAVESRVRLRVQDTGSGISADFLQHVFDRFRQADSSTTRTHGGLGLGLSIVRHLTELHGGTVAAHSEGDGRGALFTVELPSVSLRNVANTANGNEFDGPPAVDSNELRGLRILVVDDVEDGRELLRVMLQCAGADVETASSVAEALEAITRRPPDLLLSDIGLPGENGFDLVRKLRAMSPDRGGRLPAIALTAYASDNDRTTALASGFQAHLAKPLDRGQLFELIAQVLSRQLDDSRA